MSDLPEGLTLSPPAALPDGLSATRPQQAAPAPMKSATGAMAEVTDRFLASTGVGRILHAFGQGAADGWGAEPLGLSEESTKALKEAGVFQDAEAGRGGWLRAFNEAILRPLAVAGDTALRGGTAALYGIGAAGGQIAREKGTGLVPGSPASLEDVSGVPASQMTRDLIGMAINTGVIGTGRIAPRAEAPTKLGEEVKPGESAPTPAPEPIKAEVPTPSESVVSDTAPPPPREQAAPSRGDSLFGPADGDVVDKAGNIRLDNLDKPEDVKQVFRDMADANNGFEEARGGVIPLSERIASAEALGLTPENFTGEPPPGVSWSTWTEGVKRLAIDSAEQVRDAFKKAATGSDEDVVTYAEAKARHQMIQEQFSKVTAEGGRTLDALKKDKATKIADESLNDFLKRSTGRTLEDLRNEAKLGAELDTPQQIGRFLDDARKPGFGDRLVFYYRNALLSGPATHSTYALANMATAESAVFETGVAATIGRLRQFLPDANPERVYFGEMAARQYGLAQGAGRGIPYAYRAVKAGVPLDLPGNTGALAAGGKASINQQIMNSPLGKAFGAPMRVISGMHAEFYLVGYDQELNALAYRQAAKEAGEGAGIDAVVRRAREIAANPEEGMMDKAAANAVYVTNTGELGGFGQVVQRVANYNAVTKIIDPFVHVPGNILRKVIERTPMAFLDERTRGDLFGANGAAARDTAWARVTMGTAFASAIYQLATQDLITGGGPSDPKERATWALTHQPYSARVGDSWYSYKRLAPWGTVAGAAADVAEIAHKVDAEGLDKAAGMIVKAGAGVFVDESWMRGPSEMMRAIQEPERYGAVWARNQAVAWMPFSVGLGQTAAALDPLQREVRSLPEAFANKVPFLRQTLRPKLDMWGEEMPNEKLGPDEFSAIAEQRVNNDPVNLKMQDLKIWPAPIERQIDGVKLTDQQHWDYQQQAGKLAKMLVSAHVALPGFDSLPAYVQQEMINGDIAKARDVARKSVLMDNDFELLAKAVDQKVDQWKYGKRLVPPTAK